LRSVEQSIARRRQEVVLDHEADNAHAEMQMHLLTIGASLGYRVAIASNDRSRGFAGQKFSSFCVPELPVISSDAETQATIGLIDVLWLTNDATSVVSAFEVEKSTSIYSGILGLTDLSLCAGAALPALYLVIPDGREKDVRAQLRRPALASHGRAIRYILFSELRKYCDAVCKLGADHIVMLRLAKSA
jgi:type II restriction enzyme